MSYHEIVGLALVAYLGLAAVASVAVVGMAAFWRDDEWPDGVTWRRR